jgi:hypothetical protein
MIHSFSDDEGGIELQILNATGSGGTLPVDHSSRTSVEHHSQSDELSCANSAQSVDFQEQLASTIGELVGMGERWDWSREEGRLWGESLEAWMLEVFGLFPERLLGFGDFLWSSRFSL